MVWRLLLSIPRWPALEANEHSQTQTATNTQPGRHERNQERRKVHKWPKTKLPGDLIDIPKVDASHKKPAVLGRIMPQTLESQGDSEERAGKYRSCNLRIRVQQVLRQQSCR